MNRTQLPAPPDPARFTDFIGWQRAAYQWMNDVKGRLETDSRANTTPVGPFVVGAYTLQTSVTGTDSLSNYVASLTKALEAQGITAANLRRDTT